MAVAAVIVGAGVGARLGRATPKALVEVSGRPMVAHAVAAFAAAASVDRIVVVLPAGHHDVDLGPDVRTVPGGATRQESVSAGLDACGEDVRVVAVHDAARPMVTTALIERTIAALQPPWDAVAPGLPVVDTLKVVEGSRQTVLRTVDRESVWHVQTPQVSSRATLERVHARHLSADDAATDDLSLIERAGGRVRLVPGERRNFKVTHAEDLALAERLLSDTLRGR